MEGVSTISDRVVTVIIDVADKTNNKLDGVKKSLLAIDAAAQRTRAKLAAIGNRAYSATIRLIDRVSQPGSRINSFLKSLANKTYTIGMRLNDAVFGKIRSLEASLMRIAGRAYTVAVNLKDNVSGKIKGIADGALMGVGGMGLGLMGGAGIGYGAVNAAQAYMNFEKQMSKVQAVAMLDKSSPEMQMLTQQAKDLGASTAWTREQVGQAQYYQAMAGWSPELIQKATPAILNLASAGATDLATTSDIVTDTLTGFQIRADETYRDSQGRYVNAAEHYADIMAKLVTSANTDIPQLGNALAYSSNVVGAMYADKDIQTRMHAAEDAMVMTGLMANAGIKGSMAGTATRAVFSRFGSENRNAYFGLQALGVDFKDANGEVRRIRDIFHDLNQRFSQGVSAEGIAEFAEMMTETKLHADTRRKLTSFMESVQKNSGKMTGADKLKLSSMLAGQEAMSGFMAAIMGDWDALGEKIDNAHGAAQAMAEIQLDNLSGSLTLLGSAWDAFQQGFFEGGAGDGLRNFVQSLTEVISRANELFKDGIQVGDIGKLIADVVDRLKNKFMELDGIGSILAGGALMAAFVKIGRTVQKVIGYIGQLKGLQIGQMLGGATGAKGGTVAATASVGTMNVTAGVVNITGKAGGVGGAAGKAGTVIGGASSAARTATGVAASGVTSAVTVAQQNLDKARADYNKLNSQLLAAQARRDNTWNYVSRLHAQGASDSQLATARGVARAESARFAQEQSKILPHLTAASNQMAQAQSRLRAAERSAASANTYYGQRQAFNEQINSRVAAYNAQIAQSKQIIADQRAALANMKSNFMGGAKGGAAFAAIFGMLDVFNQKGVSAERAKEAADALNVAKAEYQELVRQNRPLEELAQHAEKIQGLETDQKRILQENKSAERDALAGATGSVLGAAIGAGLGSFIGPLGTMIGGMIGGMIGDKGGRMLNEIETQKPETTTTTPFFDYDGTGKPKAAEAITVKTPPATMGNFRIAEDTSRNYYLKYQREQLSGQPSMGDFRKVEEGYYQRQAQVHRFQVQDEKFRSMGLKQYQGSTFDVYGEGQSAMQRFKTRSRAATEQAIANWTASTEKFATVAKSSAENAFGTMAAVFAPSMLIEKLLGGGKAEAAELSPEQVAYQESMERPLTGDTVSERVLAGLNQPATELSQPESTPLDFSSITEQLYSDMESFTEGINELFSGIGESISETLTASFEGVGETFSGFTDSITENLTSAFEGINEYFSEIGAMFSENLAASFESVGETFNSLGSLISESLTTSFEGAAEMFTAFGESLTSTLTTAQASAETSLLAIGTAFETTKSTVQSSWAEMPGFFEGIFSGLGGAASSAGAAIAAGLTAPIGSIIGAWQSAASQISSIISSISVQAAAMPSISNVGGGGGSAYAEGGFVNSPTQALIGEAGAEVVIPLSGSKRSRAIDLFNKTAAILGEGAAIPMSDFTADDIPELDNTFSGFTLDAPTPVAANGDKTSNSAEVSMGGINVTFNISGADNPQQIMETIKENLADLADKIAGQLSKTVLSSFNNMSIGH